MRIGINALFLQKPTTGMGQHLLHLLEGLDSLEEKDQQYMLLAPRFRRAYTVRAPQLSDRFRAVEVVSALATLLPDDRVPESLPGTRQPHRHRQQ